MAAERDEALAKMQAAADKLLQEQADKLEAANDLTEVQQAPSVMQIHSLQHHGAL